MVSRDGKWLYVAQSAYGDNNPRELRRYPINDDGSTGACEVLHNFYPHRGIDGICWDSDGNIIATAGWEESGPGPMLYVFASNGRVLETHPLPTDHRRTVPSATRIWGAVRHGGGLSVPHPPREEGAFDLSVELERS